MQNNISEKVAQLIQLKQQSYTPLLESNYLDLENNLGVVLPLDLRTLNSNHRYDFLEGGFPFYNWRLNDNFSIIHQTRALRETWDLPHEYLILCNQDNVNFIFLKTISVDKSEVIWCGLQDLYNLCAGRPLEHNPTIFPSFTAFYEYLIDEEERLLAEEEGMQPSHPQF